MSTIDLFHELLNLENESISTISNSLMLNKNTIKKWLENNRVPSIYYNDLNRLLKYKYPDKNKYRNNDQFYTKKAIAKKYVNIAMKKLKELDFNLNEYIFIEPSVGCCNFYDNLPSNRRIGIDINPINNVDIIKQNFLDYLPKKNKKYIVIGNPPFGLRGNLALRFICHSSNFADAVCFVLPKLFNSDGKGVPKKRVKYFKLAYTEELPLNSFEYPNKNDVNISTIFQIWIKKNTHLITEYKVKTCENILKVYSLSDGGTPSSTRNKRMIGKCDLYLPSTTFKNVKCVDKYELLPHKRGYGIVFLSYKKELMDIFKKINWNTIAFLSTNSALNLRVSLIKNEAIKRGYFDR